MDEGRQSHSQGSGEPENGHLAVGRSREGKRRVKIYTKFSIMLSGAIIVLLMSPEMRLELRLSLHLPWKLRRTDKSPRQMQIV